MKKLLLNYHKITLADYADGIRSEDEHYFTVVNLQIHMFEMLKAIINENQTEV